MTIPRRRVLRRPSIGTSQNPRLHARAERQQAELAKSRTALKRWLTRLKRATNTVACLHARISRLESQVGSSAG